MKKICMIVFGMIFVCGAYATTDIAADATTGDCTEPTLGTYSGSADLEAKWNANAVPIRWYDNNTAIQNASNTCNYDGILTLPTPPERIGYTFDGWKVRPMTDFSKLAPDGAYALLNGIERWGKGLRENSNGADVCYYTVGSANGDTLNCKTNAEFNDLKQQEWKVSFSTGVLYGTAKCSAKEGNRYDRRWPIEHKDDWLGTYNELEYTGGEKQYCWCQATGWKPNNNNQDSTLQIGTMYANSNDNILYDDSSNSPSVAWVYGSNLFSGSFCAAYCSIDCTLYVKQDTLFRRALFLGTGE